MLEFGNFGGFDGLEVKKGSANLGGRQQGRRRCGGAVLQGARPAEAEGARVASVGIV